MIWLIYYGRSISRTDPTWPVSGRTCKPISISMVSAIALASCRWTGADARCQRRSRRVWTLSSQPTAFTSRRVSTYACFSPITRVRQQAYMLLSDFEKVLVTVALLFRRNPDCRFYVTYHLRRYPMRCLSMLNGQSQWRMCGVDSINRTIAPLLLRWGMTAKVVDKHGFLDQQSDEQDQEDSSFESVYLYEIAPI